MKDFFKTQTGKNVEKYLWELVVLTLGLGVTIATDANVAYIAFLVPLTNQITKWINQNKIKKND